MSPLGDRHDMQRRAQAANQAGLELQDLLLAALESLKERGLSSGGSIARQVSDDAREIWRKAVREVL